MVPAEAQPPAGIVGSSKCTFLVIHDPCAGCHCLGLSGGVPNLGAIAKRCGLGLQLPLWFGCKNFKSYGATNLDGAVNRRLRE